MTTRYAIEELRDCLDDTVGSLLAVKPPVFLALTSVRRKPYLVCIGASLESNKAQQETIVTCVRGMNGFLDDARAQMSCS